MFFTKEVDKHQIKSYRNYHRDNNGPDRNAMIEFKDILVNKIVKNHGDDYNDYALPFFHGVGF